MRLSFSSWLLARRCWKVRQQPVRPGIACTARPLPACSFERPAPAAPEPHAGCRSVPGLILTNLAMPRPSKPRAHALHVRKLTSHTYLFPSSLAGDVRKTT